jgi:hypothetical protein
MDARLTSPPPPRLHAFDPDDLCPRCGAHLNDAAVGLIGCEAPDWTNPISYTGLAVTPGEQILGMTPFDKGVWIGHAAAVAGASATAQDVFAQWKRRVYVEATARFGDPAPIS